MDLTSSLFIGLGLVAIIAMLALVGMVCWTVRSLRIHDQLFLPFDAEEFVKFDNAVRRAARERLSDE